jgi:hypothetical protein
MVVSLLCILYLGSLISTIVAMMGKCPLYVPVLLTSIGLLLNCVSLH